MRALALSETIPEPHASLAYVRFLYDRDFDGIFETERFRPGVTPELAAVAFAPGLEQPYTDEAIIGYRRQLGADFGLDVAFIHRVHKKRYADVDINGFYPDGPHQPFGGFGRVDPDRGIFNQLQNNTWSELVYNGIEATLVKRMSKNWHRQWRRVSPTGS